VKDDVVDDRERERLVIVGEDGAEAELFYERDSDRLYLIHTEVPPAFRGQGTGGRLVAAALAVAGDEGLTVVPWCPFARRWLRAHPDRVGNVRVDWEGQL
jgi:predicted GNAT family acetyltransferase